MEFSLLKQENCEERCEKKLFLFNFIYFFTSTLHEEDVEYSLLKEENSSFNTRNS